MLKGCLRFDYRNELHTPQNWRNCSLSLFMFGQKIAFLSLCLVSTIPKRGLYSLVHVSIWRYSDDGVGNCSGVTCHPILTMSADIWNCSSATVSSFNSWSFFSVIVSSYSIVLTYMSPSTSVSCTHSSRLTQSIKYDHFISRCIIAQWKNQHYL